MRRDGAGYILSVCMIGGIEMNCRLHEVVALGEGHLKRDTDNMAGIMLNMYLALLDHAGTRCLDARRFVLARMSDT
jgi:hypothetical protein